MSPRTSSRCRTALVTGALAAAYAPAAAAIAPARCLVAPQLSGIAPGDHIALTFDDGPDPRSTPAFLDLLAAHRRRATFFVLGEQAAEHPDLVRRMASEGHEVAVHGWTHRGAPWCVPAQLAVGIRRTRELVSDLTGRAPTFYRPPYGLLTTEALVAARGARMRTVLWTAWGREWERYATPYTVAGSVMRALRPGGCLLLHDSDAHAPRGDWRTTLAATSHLLAGPLREAHLGPLAEHWS